jgi:hypothetical protein
MKENEKLEVSHVLKTVSYVCDTRDPLWVPQFYPFRN